MIKSDSIKELAIALNKAQSEMSGAKKGAANPFFKSKYADLEEVINCAKTPLSDNGLSISQFPVTQDNKAGVVTILMHVSGEFLEDTLLLNCSKQDPQGMGSAITYARRYAYQSVLGIPSEDDDGNNASKPAYEASRSTLSTKPTYQQPVKASTAGITKTGITKKAILSAFKACKSGAELSLKWNKAGTTEFAKDPEVMELYAIRANELSKGVKP